MTVTIFEGPDGAGKSTLIQAWERRLGPHPIDTTIEANGPYLTRTGDEVAQIYLGQLQRPGRVLLDRAWPSEAVYGPIARSVNRLPRPAVRMLERMAWAASTVIVACLPPYEVCRAAYLKRKELEYLSDETQLRAVYDAYAKGLDPKKLPNLPTLRYDWTEEPSRRTFIDLVEQCRPARNEGPGIGRWAPDEVTLLVGERINLSTCAAPYPFISFDRNGCAWWLTEQLEAWSVPERDLYWVNALEPDGKKLDGAWLEQLRPRRIVALGNTARGWCDDQVKLGVISAGDMQARFYMIPHPQTWKRFHHNEPYPLKELLT